MGCKNRTRSTYNVRVVCSSLYVVATCNLPCTWLLGALKYGGPMLGERCFTLERGVATVVA